MDIIAILRSELGVHLGRQIVVLTGLAPNTAEESAEIILPAMIAAMIEEHRDSGSAFSAVKQTLAHEADIAALNQADQGQLHEFIKKVRPVSDHMLGSERTIYTDQLAERTEIPTHQLDDLLSLASPQVSLQLNRIIQLAALDETSFQELLTRQDEPIRKALGEDFINAINENPAMSPSTQDESSAEEVAAETMFIPDLAEKIKQSLTDQELEDITYAPGESTAPIADGSPIDTQEISAAPREKPEITTRTASPAVKTEATAAVAPSAPESLAESQTIKKNPSLSPSTNTTSEESTMSSKSHETYNEKSSTMKWLIAPFILFLLIAAWLLSTCSGPNSVDVSAPSMDIDPSKLAGEAMDTVSDTASAMGDAVGNAVDSGMEMAGSAADTVGDTVGSAVDAGAGLADAAAEKAGDAVEGTQSLAGAIGDAAAEATEAAGAMIDSATDTVAAAMPGAKQVDLPDGTALKLSEGSPVDQIVTFLKSEDSATALPKAFILRGLNFKSGSSLITEDSSKIVSDLAATLSAYPSVKILLAGHTDSQGAAEFNKSLSASRAAAIKDALVAAGIDSARIETEGFGEENPIDDNSTAAGRLENRRVEVIITEK